jgi:RNA polymerase sigma-70 factor (ECF subfamily)
MRARSALDGSIRMFIDPAVFDESAVTTRVHRSATLGRVSSSGMSLDQAAIEESATIIQPTRAHDPRPHERLGTDFPDAARMRLLYHRHAAALWRYALRLTSDRVRSEDLVQETLLRAWLHPEISDDSERSARAWLLTVARNMIIDESRSSRFRNEVSLHESAEVAGPAGADEADAAVDRVLIAEAFARLSAEHRAVIWRYFYLTWTTAQIAQDLHIPNGTVKSRLHSALRKLRHSLQEMGVRR